MAEARFTVYDVAYQTRNPSLEILRAAIAAECEDDAEAMLEQQIRGFFIDMKPEIYKIKPTRYKTDRMGVMSNSLLDIDKSPVAI